jgi:hypothetical protein
MALTTSRSKAEIANQLSCLVVSKGQYAATAEAIHRIEYLERMLARTNRAFRAANPQGFEQFQDDVAESNGEGWESDWRDAQ